MNTAKFLISILLIIFISENVFASVQWEMIVVDTSNSADSKLKGHADALVPATEKSIEAVQFLKRIEDILAQDKWINLVYES